MTDTGLFRYISLTYNCRAMNIYKLIEPQRPDKWYEVCGIISDMNANRALGGVSG
jgi:hypothetical protein